VLNTGFGHYENARADRVYPYGVGPFLDGLFGQSNYGIVTKIGLWLLPEPEAFNFFYFQVPKFEDLGRAIDRLRPLRMQGILQTAIHIGNDFRVLAGSSAYPWDRTGGKAPLPDDVRQSVRRERGAQAWQGSGSITGTPAHVRATRQALRRAMRGLSSVKFVTDRKLAFAERVTALANRFGYAKEFGAKLRILRPNYELLKGIPTPEPLLGAQWRLRNRPAEGPVDPLGPGCGLYWISPVMPMTGAEAHRLLGVAEPVFKAHGFDMIVSFILLTERSLVAIFNVAFDKSVEGEPEQASACYEALVDAFMESGFILYRCGLQGMSKLQQNGDVFWDVARQIKETLDPDDIIARGRYIPPLARGLPDST
jgi:4-cresol dehydrogenase (hydroxylating)